MTDTRHMMKIKAKQQQSWSRRNSALLLRRRMRPGNGQVSKQSLSNVSELRMTVTQRRSVKARLLWSLNIVAPHIYFLFQLQLAVLAYQV